MRELLGLSHSPVSAAPGEMPLPADVEVHMVEVQDSAEQVAEAESLLTPNEVERARRIVSSGARKRFTISRATLRLLLAKQLGVEPIDVKFAHNAHGKPRLEHDGELTFNVSHSGDIALIALRCGGRVGIDVERVDPRRDWRRLARAACTGDERIQLIHESRTRGATAFFERWTAKEAFLKALGIGLSYPLTDLVLARNPSGSGSLRLQEPPRDCSIHRLQVPTGYKAALALLDVQAPPPRELTCSVMKSEAEACRAFRSLEPALPHRQLP